MPQRLTRSPLKAVPLRNPGQSIQDEIDRIADDEILDNIVYMFFFFGLWSLALVMWLFPAPAVVMVVAMSAVLILAGIWCIPKIVRGHRRLKPLLLGRDGERAVAECLDLIRGDGHWVLHDLIAEGFNLDHVIVSTHGIYVVETKTISKPVAGDHRVVFDGERVVVGGFVLDRNPITQARAQAAWLRTLLKEMTGKTFMVRPVVVYPGWFVERGAAEASDTWVLEPKALKSFIEHVPPHLPKAEVALIVNRLKLFVRGGLPPRP